MNNLSFTITGKGPEGAKVVVSKGDRYLATITIRRAKKRVGGSYPYEVWFEEYPVLRVQVPRKTLRMVPRELREIAESFFRQYYRRIPERGDLISRIIGGG